MLEGSSFSILVPSLLPSKQKIEGLSIDRENFTGELLYSRLETRKRTRFIYILNAACVAVFLMGESLPVSRRSLCVVASCYLCNCYKRSWRTTWKWAGVNIKKPLVFVA